MSYVEERDVARWGRDAREWLTRDERGRTIGLVILSVTISIALSLLATALIGFVSRRRAKTPVDAVPPGVGEPLAEAAPAPEQAVGVPVMGPAVASTEAGAIQAVGA